MVTEGIFHIDLVPQIDHGIPAHFSQSILVGTPPCFSLQAQSRTKAPVRFEIIADLPVDGADYALQHFIRNLV
jgi:hypothetical protein